MKKLFFLTCLSVLAACSNLKAQFTGSRFVSGYAAINFNNSKEESSQSTNSYGYNFDVNLGKFRSENMAMGWRLGTALSGGKDYFQPDDSGYWRERKGVNELGFGVGRFWQFYKHFNEHVGIYAGPDVNLGFMRSKSYPSADSDGYMERKSNQINVSLGISAGAYYKLSEKWWITASLAFSSPVFVSYAFIEDKRLWNTDTFKSNEISYQLSPRFSFPSVGLGVRYICNK